MPSAFVVLALLALLVLPMAVQERLDDLRTEIEDVAQPARDLLTEVQYLLARETSNLRGFVITGDSVFIEQYERFAQREREIYPELEQRAGLLSSTAVAEVVTLRTLSAQWHDRLEADELADRTADSDALWPLLEQELYLSTLEAASRADLALRGAIFARAQEIREVERFTRTMYTLLLLLAIGATVSVALLNARIRRLATEADLRHGEVERALEETARAVEARSSLIRGFSHDVKNPLGAADGYASLLQEGVRGELTEVQMDTVKGIRQSIGGAIEIIEELLDLSRLESGGLNIRREETDVAALAEDLVRHHAVAARDAGLEIRFQPPEDPPIAAYTDPARVRQILDNLLSNARKYTQVPGRVAVRVSRASGEAIQPGRWLLVSVADTGPGIPEEEIQRIFDEFHRVPGTRGSGHGLGLSISRGIARLLGGDVTVQSTLGKGSEFQLWIPVRTET
ncbi:MAG: HAMP domain-containing sensor histidine kinase [Gemmatimonadota bacterium]